VRRGVEERGERERERGREEEICGARVGEHACASGALTASGWLSDSLSHRLTE
jgi:hypothetical protein